RYGTSDHQATFLAHLTSEAPAPAALAIQEPQPLFDPFALRTEATRHGDQLRVTGTKAMVPLGTTAELFVVGVRLDDEPRLLIVPAETAGLRVEADPAMGMRAAATGRLTLTDATVPEANLLGSAEDY